MAEQRHARDGQSGSKADESLLTADEFRSADELDNDVESNVAADRAMGLALEQLRGQHLSFRKPDKDDEARLEELRLRILHDVTALPELEDYYLEAWSVTGDRAATTLDTPPHLYRRVAVMQLELMVRAFYVLQLQLYANAPENHGWVTLFRSWGRSRRFNLVFAELEATLNPEFRKFYRLYLHDLPSRASSSGHLPVHHPWLEPDARKKGLKGRGLYMDSGRVEAEIELEVRPGAGGVGDQRGREGADQPFERPSGGEPPKKGSAPNE